MRSIQDRLTFAARLHPAFASALGDVARGQGLHAAVCTFTAAGVTPILKVLNAFPAEQS